MKSRSNILTAAAIGSLSLIASEAVAQTRGPFAGFAHGATFGTEGAPRLKPTGDQASPPPALFSSTPAGGPVFRVDALFPSASAGSIRIDAMSTGNDALGVLSPMGNDYAVDPGTADLGWVSLTISVSDQTTATGGPMLTRANNTGLPLGGDLFTYFFYGNGGLTPGFADDVYFSAGTEHFGFGMSPTSPTDLASLDTYMPSIAQAKGVADRFELEMETDYWYFSLDSASAAYLVSNFNTGADLIERFPNGESLLAGPTPIGELLTGSTVFVATWSVNDWSIDVLATPSDLGLDPSEEVDALAYDRGSPYVVFSTESNQLPQLLVADIFAGTHGELLANDGVRVIEKFEIDENTSPNVDAICGRDPEQDVQRSIGQPIALGLAYGGLELSVQRRISPSDVHHLYVQYGHVPAGAALAIHEVYDVVNPASAGPTLPRGSTLSTSVVTHTFVSTGAPVGAHSVSVPTIGFYNSAVQDPSVLGMEFFDVTIAAAWTLGSLGGHSTSLTVRL